jgi:hypothetical protein
MSAVAEKTDPKLWDRVKRKVTRSAKGGEPGQWSARKAQTATQEYKKAGGDYRGRKSADNHLEQWQEEDWGTKSGAKSGETGERYLPRTAREHLSDAEYKRTTAKKRADSRKGKQVSAQPKDVAAKTARDRKTGHAGGRSGPTKAELMQKARDRNISGRSKMNKQELEKAVA